MSEATRQRWLHVHNRMQELNAKYGPLEEVPLPPWLDSLEGYLSSTAEVPVVPESAPAAAEEPPEIQAALAAPASPPPPTRRARKGRRRGSDW